MSNWSNKKGGYENLIVYQQGVVISGLNHEFCEKYLADLRYRRTVEQMEQADRSGKQNIVEGSLEKSLKMNIKLTGVSRASYGELLEDYRDFLRFRKLTLWGKEDPQVLEIRAQRESPNKTNKSDWSNKSYLSRWSKWTSDPESFANLQITLISRENYLLDQMLRSLEEKFITEGGYSENLTKKRLDFIAKKNKL